MKLVWQAHSIPKAGCAPEENEDALAMVREAGRVAVCDGASEGWGSGPWARHLANALVHDPANPQSFVQWLARARQSAVFTAAPVVSWYAETKQKQGAFCTLLGLSFSTGSDGGVRYHALAIGDTTLIHMREDKIAAKFPIEKSNQFTNRPTLLGSTIDSGEPLPEWFAGRADVGDRFYLMTDALAEWFLQQAEADEEPWASIDAVTSAVDPATEYAAWVQSLRDRKLAKNDDATLVRVRIA